MSNMTIKRIAVAVAAGLSLLLAGALPSSAGHNVPEITVEYDGANGTATAEWADPDGTHRVGNARLVVFANGKVQTAEIGGDPITFTGAAHVRVFGGGERSYDVPLWDGFGEEGFADAINAYIAEHGFGWLLGQRDSNPFVNWRVYTPGRGLVHE